MAPPNRKIVFLPRLNIEILQSETLLFLAETPSTDGTLLDLMAKYFLTTEPLIRKIVRHPNVWDATLNYLRMFGSPSYQDWIHSPPQDALFPLGSESDSADANLFQQVQRMKASEKIQLALKGNKEARALLLKDNNKQVVMSVLNSPRLTEQEVEFIAASRNVSEEILRVVAGNRNWLKNNAIVAALVNNPKTPVGLSLGFLKNLKVKDLGVVSKNKGIPEVIRSSARRMLETKKGGG